ncbi:MAG: hypothetical protein M1838_005704 [Thelocarpon superellum]|nr:MAG: hypothetical protein M1838_005704 [Thelocarpon superellum]
MTSDNCAVGSTLCPATLGFGCCGTDFDCGLSTCYPRTTSSFVATLSVVTTDAQSSATTQVTVVATAYIPASASTSSGPAFPKASSYTTTSSFAPVAKVSSTSALTGGGGGLSPAAIGGLGGGVGVGLFVVVAVLAWLFRRSRHLPHGGWSHGSSTLGQTSHANGGSRGFFRPKHKHKTSDPDIFALSGSGRVDSSGYYAAAAKSDESASDRFVGIDIPRLPQRECFGDLNIPHSPSSDVTRPPFDRTGSDGSASTMRRDHEEESVGQPPTSIQGDVVSELADTDLRSSRANVLFGFANPWQSGAARNRLPSVAEGDTNQTVPE